MMKKINNRTNISALLSVNGQTALAGSPHRWHRDRHQAIAIVPTHNRSWQRTVELDAPARSTQLQPKRKQRHLVPVTSPQISDPATNPRQWLLAHTPRLAKLITETIGDRWIAHLEDLQQLVTLADDPLLQSKWRTIKRAHKQVLANELYRSQGIGINIDSLFDLQLQPIGGQQRQLLSILHLITLYQEIKDNPGLDFVPRTFIFGEIASPDLTTDEEPDLTARSSSEMISRLITSLAAVFASDPDLRGKLQVVYVPQSAGLTNQLYCAADLTEQIATAGMADVDLSQLKFAIGGVLSISSMSKANHLLQQSVGAENCFSFGLAIPEIAMFKEYGYEPENYYKYYPEIRSAIDALLSGKFTPEDADLGQSVVNLLLGSDEHLVLADYVFYRACQIHVAQIYRQPSVWTRMSILNVAGVG